MSFVRIPNTNIVVNTDNISSFQQWHDEDKQELYTEICFIDHYERMRIYSSTVSFEELLELLNNSQQPVSFIERCYNKIKQLIFNREN